MFTLIGHFIEKYGYGNLALHVREGIRRLGGRIETISLQREDGSFISPEQNTERWQISGPAMALTIPPWWRYFQADRLVGFTMNESTALPAEFVAPIDELAERMIVPSQHCREVFERMTRVPVEVVPLGLDPDEYRPVDRSGHDGPYTFLWSGTPDQRKGWDLVYRAFWRAFGDSKNARLVMHFRIFPAGLKGCQDPNVRLVQGLIPQAEWQALLAEADAFVYPARGEGWGLPPREAAATGLPVMATDWSGLRDEIGHWALPLRVARMVPASFGPWDPGQIGEWAEPDLDTLVDWMRWCYEHRAEAAGFGARASAWLRMNCTWERTARGVLAAMGEHYDQDPMVGQADRSPAEPVSVCLVP